MNSSCPSPILYYTAKLTYKKTLYPSEGELLLTLPIMFLIFSLRYRMAPSALLRTVPLYYHRVAHKFFRSKSIRCSICCFFFFFTLLLNHPIYIHTKLNFRPLNIVLSAGANVYFSPGNCVAQFSINAIILNDLFLSRFIILSNSSLSSPIFSHLHFLIASPPLLSLFLPSIHVSVNYGIASCQTYRGQAVDLPYKNRCLNINCTRSYVFHSCISINITLRDLMLVSPSTVQKRSHRTSIIFFTQNSMGFFLFHYISARTRTGVRKS